MNNEIPPGKWYHEATINGVKMPQRRPRDTSEKRWNELIKPLMPPGDGGGSIFVDLGSNAGFYMRKAVDMGYRVEGVEKRDDFITHARYWEDNDPKGVKTIHMDINDYDVPAARVVLMANIIYWLKPRRVRNLIKKLRGNALYVIVIGRPRCFRGHKSPCDIEGLKKEFEGWEVVKIASNYNHHSILFKNLSLCEAEVDELFLSKHELKNKMLIPAYNNLIDMVESGQEFNREDTDYFKYFMLRGFQISKAKQLFRRHINIVADIKKNGIRKLLVIGRMFDGKYCKNCILGGDHRFIVAKRIGIKKVICCVNTNHRI